MTTSCNGAWLFSYHFWSEAFYTKLFSEPSYLEQLCKFFSKVSSLYIWSAHSSRGDSSVEEDNQTKPLFHLICCTYPSTPLPGLSREQGSIHFGTLREPSVPSTGMPRFSKVPVGAASLSQKTSIRTCFRKLKEIQRLFLVLWKQANSEWRSAFVLRWAV